MGSPMNLRLVTERLFSEKVGDKGLDDKDLDSIRPLMEQSHEALAKERREKRLPFMDLPFETERARAILKEAVESKGSFDDFVVLGIGGSALGARAVQTALNHPFHDILPREKRGGWPRLFVLDNIDPDLLSGFLDTVQPERALFNVISKSGSTAETMAQFLLFYDMLRNRVGEKAPEHLVITTGARSNPLRDAAKDLGCRSHEVPEGVGGRFSVLSPVGLVPAAYTGVDILALLEGAAAMEKRCASPDPDSNPALFYAAAQHLLDRLKGIRISVLFTYSHLLQDLMDWYRQLLAESLGKRVDLNSREVHEGITPVNALGVTDQHSQVQLYVEGPPDKSFTFLTVDEFQSTLEIPKPGYLPDGCGYLAGQTFNKLFQSERMGTALALKQAGRPSMEIAFPRVSAETVGQFFYMMERHIAYSGKLYGIDPFDQPGVEAGKQATYALMNRPGFEEKGRAILREMEGDPRRVIR